MMPKDGGSAFPSTRTEISNPTDGAVGKYVDVTYSGLTVRDYFAAHAIGVMKGVSAWDTAVLAYRLADEMLKVREDGEA
jgi:hypothetical protein